MSIRQALLTTAVTGVTMGVAMGVFAQEATTPSTASPPQRAPSLQEGVKILAGGVPVSVRIGHLVPCAMDWNTDGKKDLVVGQFMGGSIRVYLNEGTDVAPEFGDFTYLDAGAKEIHLPAG